MYECVQCPENTYSEAGATQCTNCPDGKQSDAGSRDCSWSKYMKSGQHSTKYLA